MNVLALLTDGFGGAGGIARYNHDLMMAISQSAAVSHVSILPRFGHAPDTLPETLRQFAPRRNKIDWSAKALSLAAGSRFDLVYCGHLYAAPFAAMIAKATRARLWVQAHGIEAWSPRPRSGIEWALQHANLVTSVSRYTRRRLLEWSRIVPERVRVLPNTVDPRFAPGPKSAELIDRLDAAGRAILLSVSRLAAPERYKGQDRVIAAMPHVLSKRPDVIYVIAGDGDDRPRLESLARQLGVSDNVRFVGRVADDALIDYYRTADVFVMPSTGEGFGIVFLEAAACGLPVIAGNGDGSVDALAEGAIGRLVSPGSANEISNAILAAVSRSPSDPCPSVARFQFANFAQHVDDLLASLA
ncbi:MAG: glycosyltransferase family 4 protein [Hyphomicrobium sp.]